MRVAVVGGGISGLVAAERLASDMDVTLFEAATRLGGHADTHQIEVDDGEGGQKTIAVDTGFIVFNPENYPTFYGLLQKYQVPYKDSDMSFAVSNQLTGLEYNAGTLNGLFSQRKNIISLKFYRMLRDIFRFYREAGELLDDQSNETLGNYLKRKGYSQQFTDEHILPMACALWSGDSELILEFPARYLVAFMNNHQMMQAFNRPVWKTIEGGSKTYIDAVAKNTGFQVKLGCPINKVIRNHQTVWLHTAEGKQEFDYVIFACHSDQALSMLEQPSNEEKDILGSIQYQENHITLHCDTNLLPSKRRAWASWNVMIDEKTRKQCTVSYCMNLLQSLETDTPVIVSLNMAERVNPELVWKQLTYHHPVYTQATIKAQQNKGLIQGHNRSYFSGAYWGWGFHEDGARSGLEAAEQLLKDSGYA
jgi:predicted NAD/FAD-binding protein